MNKMILMFCVIPLVINPPEVNAGRFTGTSRSFTLHIVESFPPYLRKYNWANAVTVCDKTDTKKPCQVYVKSTHYPRCAEHEVRHVIEGKWHDGYVGCD